MKPAVVGPCSQLIERYRQIGVAAFPVNDKQPAVRAYGKGGLPLPATTARWAERFPAANLGLSTCKAGLAVFDADDPDVLLDFQDMLGETSLKVSTPRGEHWYFRDLFRACKGAQHPGGRPFDVRGVNPSHFVLLPGSERNGAHYTLIDYAGSDFVEEFGYRLWYLPPLDMAAFNELTRTPNGNSYSAASHNSSSGPPSTQSVVLMRAPIGTRNRTLFQMTSSKAHDLRRIHGDGIPGLAALRALAAGLNDTALEAPLPADEVNRLVNNVWERTLSGKNRPPRMRQRTVYNAIRRCGRDGRALFLWGCLSQAPTSAELIEMSPVCLARQIAGWTKHDAETALRRLVQAGVLHVVTAGSRGRGRKPLYRLVEPLEAEIDFLKAYDTLNGDADAVALLAFVIEFWGGHAAAPLSTKGMVSNTGAVFGKWTEVRLRRARAALEACGMAISVPQRRSGVRKPRSLFRISSSNVLKMPEIVSVGIHAPRRRQLSLSTRFKRVK